MKTDWSAEDATWDAFLKEWPRERLAGMTLEQYTQVGKSDTFCSWIENRLDQLGSIWGGSSFKFGIFSRKDKTARTNGGGDWYDEDYGWYEKYGQTRDAVFEKVRGLIVQVAEAAAAGRYEAIDPIDLGPAYKWKIAFHYQPRQDPGIVAIFKADALKAWIQKRFGQAPKLISACHRQAAPLRGDRHILELSDEIWRGTELANPNPQSAAGIDEIEEPAAPPGVSPQSLNQILYGPPGTGKTYDTARLAVEICDGAPPSDRASLLKRYRELRGLGRVRFVSFHPSFSYEDFVEGIRPAVVDGVLRYDVRPGVFKQAAKHAQELLNERARSAPKGSLASRRFFKLSLGDSQDPAEAWLFPECIDSGYAAIGFAKGTDFSSCDTQEKVRERYLQSGQGRTLSDYALKAVEFLRLQIQVGDIILVSAGNRRVRAIGEVTGPYRYEAREDYEHQRPVDWLWQSEEGLPVETVAKKRFSQQTVYSLSADQLNISAIDELVSPKGEKGRTRNCVLVIDEINRANLAKVFGELITLLESSKRLGGEDEQEVILPYSGDSFGVPPNLFVIGTMNTADRSIALMDTALRRRFDFTEMPPQPELLAEDVEGINLRQLLVSMNEKIEELFDRDHLLGHSYLMGVHSVVELSERFKLKIIPLLQEYFFEDWSKLQQVFRDVDAPREQQIIQSAPQSSTTKAGAGRRRLQVNPLLTPAAFSKIYS